MVMSGPLLVLAAFAVGLGFLGTPAWPWLQSVLAGKRLEAQPLFEHAGLTALSVMLVGLGLGAGWWLYGRRPRAASGTADPLAAALPRLWAALAGRLGFDEFYAATVGRFVLRAAALADGFDRWIWDGLVRSLAALGEFAGVVGQQTDEDGLNAGFDGASERLRETGRVYSRAQTGEARSYLLVLAAGFAALVLWLSWGGGR